MISVSSIKGITGVVIEDVAFFSDLGLDHDNVVKAVLRNNWSRCKVGTSMTDQEIDAENQKVEQLALAILAFDKEPKPEEATADLDLASMNTVILSGVNWTRGNDKHWRPDNANQAEGAQYPFKDDELMAWFKSQS